MSILPLRTKAPAAPPSPPAPSPERLALAERIATRDEARARITALTSILDRGEENVSACHTAVRVATAAIDGTGDADAAAAVAALMSGQPQPVPTAATARADLEKAEAALTAARFARGAVQAELKDLNERDSYRHDLVKRAAVIVIRAEAAAAVAALIARNEALLLQLADAGLALSWLSQQEIVISRGDDALPGLSGILSRLGNVAIGWDYVRQPGASPTADKWRAAIDALAVDAAAPPPG
jgi:hypothetical protein